MHALTAQRLARTDVRPSPLWLATLRFAAGAWLRLPRAVDIHVDTPVPMPSAPVLYAANHTHSLDFLPLRYALLVRGQRLVTWIKPRAYADRISALIFSRTGNVPVASRGYVIATDLRAAIGRRPTDAEYRAVRDHVDNGTSLASTRVFDLLVTRARTILGVPFDPAHDVYREAIHAAFAALMDATLDSSRRAVAAGMHLHVFPQGTVSPRLTPARTGVIQAALALDIPIVPVGISGAPEALAGGLWRNGGSIHLRFGAPYRPPPLPRLQTFSAASERAHRDELADAAHDLTGRINGLLAPRYRLDPSAEPTRAGVARFV